MSRWKPKSIRRGRHAAVLAYHEGALCEGAEKTLGMGTELSNPASWVRLPVPSTAAHLVRVSETDVSCRAQVQPFWRLTCSRHRCDTLVVRPALTRSVGSTTNTQFVGFARASLVIGLAGNAAHLLQSGIPENPKDR